MIRNSYYENIWEDLEAKVESRMPYFSNFERRLLKYDYKGEKWNIENEGIVSLPMDALALNSNFKNLHGGILTFQVSNRDGLEIYRQGNEVLRVSSTKKLHRPLLYFIIGDFQKVPILYSEDNLPIRERSKFTKKNFRSIDKLVEYLSS